MSTTRATDATQAISNLIKAGGLLDYGQERSRLLLRVVRSLAQGRPVSREQVDKFINEVGISPADASALLSQVAEPGADDTIVGLLGLSLNETQHHFEVNGNQLYTWCALDTLFLPGLVGQTARIESESPVAGAKVHLTANSKGAQTVDPRDPVVSVVIVDPEAADMGSVEAIWGAFCHHVFFFTNRSDGEHWAASRDNRDSIRIVSVAEAFEIGQLLSSSLLRQAGEQ